MARNKTKIVAQHAANGAQTDEVEAFKAKVAELLNAGYVPMPLEEALGAAYNPSDPSWNGIINSHFSASCCDPMNQSKDMGRAIMSNGYEWTQNDAAGNSHSYISWGADNRTPNYIALWSRLLPYTATSLQHMSELAMGCGVQPKYRFFTVTRTKAESVTIDYDAAGDLIRRRLREAIQAKHTGAMPYNTPSSTVPDGSSPAPATVPGASPSGQQALDPELATLIDEEIAQLRADLETWKRTSREIKDFIAHSNLPLLYLKSMQELTMLGMTLPQIILDKQGEVESNAKWQPKALGIEHHPVAAFRLTKRDDRGRIRNVKMSNYWLSDRLPEDYLTNIAELPLLDEQRPSADLAERINDWKVEHKKGAVNARPTRWVMPCIYPSVGNNYYPYRAWWSIFEGDIYPYLATIISDRATRKKNSNSIGRIVYIHTDYLKSINTEQDAQKRLKKAEELRNEIFHRTTKFLNDKSKNGSTMLGYTFPDSRGNMAKSIEIVDVPYTSKQQTDADKTELAEVASIVFFAMGVHPELIGSIPGSAASKGGTYMREMLLIDEVTSAAVLQQLMSSLFQTVQSINGWDPDHLVWETPQKTLTTLDRNSSGVEEE